MAQIGFTHKTEPIYNRFQDMRRAYEDAHGRTYAPDFLTVLMDAFLLVEEIRENDKLIWEIETKQAGLSEPVSLRAYIADAEANERVVIRSTAASGMYLEKAYSFDNLFDLTNNKEFAMVFDTQKQAKAFLRKCGRVAEEWILEPVNESK